MSSDRLRHLGALEYFDPKHALEAFRRVELDMPIDGVEERVRTLRTNLLKPEREIRDAAIFCFGMSQLQKHEVFFAPVEDQDFDFVASWLVDDTQHLCPVQLKELVPEKLNRRASIEELLSKLAKYADASDVTVAIKMNRIGRFDPLQIAIPSDLKFRGLWMYAALSEDQNDWGLWGDFMQPGPVASVQFEYPKLLKIAF